MTEQSTHAYPNTTGLDLEINEQVYPDGNGGIVTDPLVHIVSYAPEIHASESNPFPDENDAAAVIDWLSSFDYGKENDDAAHVNGFREIADVEHVSRYEDKTIMDNGGITYYLYANKARGVYVLYRRPLGYEPTNSYVSETSPHTPVALVEEAVRDFTDDDREVLDAYNNAIIAAYLKQETAALNISAKQLRALSKTFLTASEYAQ